MNERLDKLIDASQSANQEIREYIRNVRKASDTEYNFILSLEKEIVNFEKQTNIKVDQDIQITREIEGI